jgi:hypothetical protein
MFRHRGDTYYDYLGVSSHASLAEIAAAYKRSIVSVHPDTVSRLSISPQEWDTRLAQTKQINEAWEILRDPECRAAYDAQMGIRPISRLHSSLDALTARLEARRGQRTAHQLAGRAGIKLGPPSVLSRLWVLLYGSRLGQWLILILAALVLHFAGGAISGSQPALSVLRGPLELAVLVALSAGLARGGAPTPLFDALAVVTAFDRVLFSALRSLLSSAGSSAGAAVSSGVEQAANAVRASHEAGPEASGDEDLWADQADKGSHRP